MGLIVSIDAGDHGVAQIHAGSGFRYAGGFLLIGRADGFARRHGAETASASTYVSQDHECGCAMFPTFAHIGATGGFADSVKIEGAHDALEIVVFFAAEKFDAEPVWARGGIRWQHVAWVGDDVEGGTHRL